MACGYKADEEEYDCHYELHIWVVGKLRQYQRVGIADFDIFAGKFLAHIYTDNITAFAHSRDKAVQYGKSVGTGIDVNIAIVVYGALVVGYYYGDGIVAIKHCEHQAEVGIFIGAVECAHCCCPHLHFAQFFLLEVCNQGVGDYKGDCCNDCRSCYEQYFYFAKAVYPLHDFLFFFLGRFYKLVNMIEVAVTRCAICEQVHIALV